MKKLVSILFILIVGVHLLPAFNNTGESVYIMVLADADTDHSQEKESSQESKKSSEYNLDSATCPANAVTSSCFFPEEPVLAHSNHQSVLTPPPDFIF